MFIGKRRYNIKLWKTFTDCFNCLPITAVIDEKIFCCHGGSLYLIYYIYLILLLYYRFKSGFTFYGADSTNNETHRCSRSRSSL